MDFYGKRTPCSSPDKGKRVVESPTHRCITKAHQQMSEPEFCFSPARSFAASTNTNPQMLGQGSESPWALSSLQTPSPPLLYRCIASLHRLVGNIYSIAVSRGIVFTGSESCRIRAWRQADCVEHGYIKASSGEVRAILAYGNLLFTSHADYKVRMWNFTVSETFRAKKLTSLPAGSSFLMFSKTSTHQHKDFVSCMAYYPAEGILYTGSWDKTVKAWEISSKRCVDSFMAHNDIVNAIVVNQENGSVFTCSSDCSVKIWRREYRESSHTLTMTLEPQASPVNTLALSSSSNTCILYSGSLDGLINFWEKEKTSSRFNHGGFLQGHRFAVLCLVAIEKLTLSGSEDTTIRIWRREEGSCFHHECLAVLDGHRGPVRCLAACLEMEKVMMGFLVYSASLDQTFKVWRVKVSPNDHVTRADDADQSDVETKVVEYKPSPILSPSWAERRRQLTQLFLVDQREETNLEKSRSYRS